MNHHQHAQRLRQLAARTGLDGIAEEMRAIADELDTALAAQGEPFGYFRAEPFGWTDCAPDDEGAIALYTTPPAPAKPMTDDTTLLDFMAERSVSVTPEYEGQWCARQYDDEAAAVAEADGATPRDVLRELHNAYFVITDKGGA